MKMVFCMVVRATPAGGRHHLGGIIWSCYLLLDVREQTATKVVSETKKCLVHQSTIRTLKLLIIIQKIFFSKLRNVKTEKILIEP